MARTVFALGMIILSVGSSAMALTWNSSTTPLTVTGYGSTGKAYGDWNISTGTDGTRYRTGANLYLINADNHKVYAKTDNYANSGSCIAPDYTSCSQTFYYYNSSETTHYNVSKAWKKYNSSNTVDPRSDYHRAYIRVKLDVPWKADPSSSPSITKGIKY